MAKSYQDLSNQTFGRLTVLRRVRSAAVRHGRWAWECRCECGNTTFLEGSRLTSGNTRSCGCQRSDSTTKKNFKHGLACRGAVDPVSKARSNILSRCGDLDDDAYGGRGIRACEGIRNSPQAIVDCIGRRPSDQHSIDRVDNNGPYSCGACEECVSNARPKNVRWATRDEQILNRRCTAFVEYDGRTITITELSSLCGLSWQVLYNRIFAYDWEVDRAISEPVRGRKAC